MVSSGDPSVLSAKTLFPNKLVCTGLGVRMRTYLWWGAKFNLLWGYKALPPEPLPLSIMMIILLISQPQHYSYLGVDNSLSWGVLFNVLKDV